MITRRTVLATAASSLAAPYLLRARAFAAEPVSGGQLRVALYKDLRTINPLKHIFGNELRTTANLYDNLTRVTPTGIVQGDLAESFEPSADARQWTFRLKPGIKFQDGSPLEAADVVATIEKLLDPATAAPYKSELGPIVAITAPEGLTVRFELASGNADFPKTMTSAAARIVSRSGLASDKLETAAFGTGPFVLKEFVPNDRVVMERNPTYHRPGRPYLDRIVMRVLPDVNTQVTALRNREVDVIADLESDTVAELAADRNVAVLQVPGGTFNGLVLYANKPPFDNPDARTALKLSLDRAACVAAVTNGFGSPADDHPISASYEFVDRSAEIRKQNVAEARRLLRGAGLGSGFEHRVVVSNSPATREKTAIVMQAMAQQAGIGLNLEMMDNARYGSTIWNKGVASYILNYSARPTEDAILTKIYSAKNGLDEGRWATPDTERLLDEARASIDRERRAKLYAEFQKLARDTGPFIIPNFFNMLAAIRRDVKDWPLHPIPSESKLDGVWVSKAV